MIILSATGLAYSIGALALKDSFSDGEIVKLHAIAGLVACVIFGAIAAF